jgi:hypothetical protein
VHLSAAARAGKTSVLNRCIPAARGEIVVLSDANTRIEPGALRALVRHFEDAEVGAVCGRLQLYNPTRAEYEESAYWKYESWLKALEGKQGAVVGANGGLYAIRRDLFSRLPPSTIVDDFVIPLRMLDQGYRVLYEPEALASEETTEDYGREFGRRARIAAGNFQSLGLVPGLLSPLRGFPAFAFWSHKVLRWCAPALMLVALAANVALLDEPFYRFTMAAQVGFYALALLGSVAVGPSFVRRIAGVPYYFVTMNLAIAVASGASCETRRPPPGSEPPARETRRTRDTRPTLERGDDHEGGSGRGRLECDSSRELVARPRRESRRRRPLNCAAAALTSPTHTQLRILVRPGRRLECDRRASLWRDPRRESRGGRPLNRPRRGIGKRPQNCAAAALTSPTHAQLRILYCAPLRAAGPDLDVPPRGCGARTGSGERTPSGAGGSTAPYTAKSCPVSTDLPVPEEPRSQSLRTRPVPASLRRVGRSRFIR